MTFDPVRLGVAGLGRAFMLMVPTFGADARVKLTAAALRERKAATHLKSNTAVSLMQLSRTYAPIHLWKRSTSPPRIKCM